MTERVVLAYSGGLDTSVAIGWMAEETGAEVIAVAVDVGQGGEDLDVIRKRALACGAVEAEVADARDEFADEYCLPAIKANALYMDRYPLVSALSRPTIVKHLVAAARKHGATTVAHGCTGKGNDQVRFEAGIAALAPDLKCVAPVRDYAMTRDKALAFCEAKHLPIATTKKSPYSIDRNVFGRAVETGFLEGIWNGPIEDIYEYTQNPAVQRDPDEVIVTFERGVPVAIDGRPVTVLQIVKELNGRGSRASAGSTWSRTASSGPSPARRPRTPRPLASSTSTASLIGLREPSVARRLKPIAFAPWCRTAGVVGPRGTSLRTLVGQAARPRRGGCPTSPGRRACASHSATGSLRFANPTSEPVGEDRGHARPGAWAAEASGAPHTH